MAGSFYSQTYEGKAVREFDKDNYHFQLRPSYQFFPNNFWGLDFFSGTWKILQTTDMFICYVYCNTPPSETCYVRLKHNAKSVMQLFLSGP
jgi:hypothetical protein